MTEEEIRSNFKEPIEEGLKKAEARLPELHKDLRTVVSDVKLLCLSEIFDNILMWSHYANNRSGIVLRLTCMPALDSVWGAARPVRYSRAMPVFLNEADLIKLMSGQWSIDRADLLEKSVFTKAEDWGYEKEWRIFGGKNAMVPFEDMPFHAEELTGVYLGCRIVAADASELIELTTARYPSAGIFKGRKAERSFTLDFDQIK
jgi:Protein of unknown function (DUF2971)